ncbi:substrate-binding domain-containing protein [Paenibacillus sp. GP183]|uniref:molybdate ABC transporter substrate-binding protein n=1 Tax=Paenibacillus sp. GP183 TaxID=1882751 RepID=UPI000899B8C5|nr:substrate-binding domain-containing protein [Paenibacillus sp. GP183]SEB71924.1 molybdenum ABC transporter, molybdate-binding protein [Paenibacillus sp. GP183]
MMKTEIEVFHADSLTGPMNLLKQEFEALHDDIEIRLTPGRSRELASEIGNGASCDIAAFSDEKVMMEEMMGKYIRGTDLKAASWYIVFSANQMVLMVPKGNPLAIHGAQDLLRPGIQLIRVAGEKDLATYRTIEFIRKAANQEGMPEIAERMIETAVKAHTIPEAIQALRENKGDSAIVYLSTAIAERQHFDYIPFPDSINLSDQIRNVLSIPSTSRNREAAMDYLRFVLSPAGRDILKQAGQPPLFPFVKEGSIPSELDI